MQPEISFIVPIYNTAKYLPSCIESLLAVPVNKEIILIDDGSNDYSFILTRDYQQKHNEIILISQTNQGVSVARNRGLAIAKGRYVQLIDSDDLVCNQHLYPQLLDIAQQQAIDFMPMMFMTQNAGHKTHCPSTTLNYMATGSWGSGLVCNGLEYFFARLNPKWYPVIWNSLIRTEFLRQHHITFDESLSYGEDGIFLYQILSAHENIRVLDSKVLVNIHRIHADSTSNTDTDENIFKQSLGNCQAAQRFLQLAAQWQHHPQPNTFSQTCMSHAVNAACITLLYNYKRSYHLITDKTKRETIRSFYPEPIVNMLKQMTNEHIEL